MGWATYPRYAEDTPTGEYCCTMTLPRRLSLADTPKGGLRLAAMPAVWAYESAPQEGLALSGTVLRQGPGGSRHPPAGKWPGGSIWTLASMRPERSFGPLPRQAPWISTRTLAHPGSPSWPPPAFMRGAWELELHFDRSICELYADGGTLVFTQAVYPDEPYTQAMVAQGQARVEVYAAPVTHTTHRRKDILMSTQGIRDFRPEIHFTPEKGWINDPNGLVYVNGEYHVFAQYSVEPIWGPMHWCHAVSRDLIHWQELPVALYPDKRGGAAFSGSAVYDKENVTGLGTGRTRPWWPCTPVTATWSSSPWPPPNDPGFRNFLKYRGNPVLSPRGDRIFQDPKLFPRGGWSVAITMTDGWPCLAGLEALGENRRVRPRGNFMPGQWQCPDLFPPHHPRGGKSGFWSSAWGTSAPSTSPAPSTGTPSAATCPISRSSFWTRALTTTPASPTTERGGPHLDLLGPPAGSTPASCPPACSAATSPCPAGSPWQTPQGRPRLAASPPSPFQAAPCSTGELPGELWPEGKGAKAPATPPAGKQPGPAF